MMCLHPGVLCVAFCTGRSQAAVACDFATVDTALLRRYYLLFFIDITTREVFYGGITTNPTGAWTTQAARNVFLRHPNRFTHTRALLRDRASQFVNDFDEIFRTEGLEVLKTPVRAPTANTIRTLSSADFDDGLPISDLLQVNTKP